MVYRGSFFIDHNISIPRDSVVSMEDINSVINNQLIILNNTDLEIANEGFLQNLFVAIADTIFHIGNNFKTLFKIYRDFKRSELRYYLESNVLRTSILLSTDFNIIRTLMIPIPRGMTTTYIEACCAVDDCLKRMDMLSKADLALEYSDVLYEQCSNGDIDHLEKSIKSNSIHFTDKELNKYFDKVNKVFANKSTGEVKLNSVYANIQDITSVNEKLLNMEDHLISVSKVYYRLEHITNKIDLILKEFKEKPELQKRLTNSLLIKLGESIRNVAVVFEKYGILINDVNTLTHNQVEVLEKIRKYVK